MPSLQVRDLPDHIYRKLADEAEREHRSLSQQAIAVLARGLGVAMDAKERRRRLFQHMRENPIQWKGKNIPDPVDLIREDRDR
jgi:hypothetical protein